MLVQHGNRNALGQREFIRASSNAPFYVLSDVCRWTKLVTKSRYVSKFPVCTEGPKSRISGSEEEMAR